MPAIDFWHPMDELNRKQQKTDPKFTLTSKDRVHPGPAGHLLMAYLFLDQTGAPRDVWRLSLDAKTSQVLSQTNCEATALTSSPKSLTFSNRELALHSPVSRMQRMSSPGFLLMNDSISRLFRFPISRQETTNSKSIKSRLANTPPPNSKKELTLVSTPRHPNPRNPRRLPPFVRSTTPLAIPSEPSVGLR